MVTVFGILNLTEDSFFDESRRLDPAGAVTAAIEMRHCCKVSDEAAFCLIQRPYISKTLLTRRISPRGSP
ncbi:hypothetical protein DFR13_23265 [Salmonella enterica subsp. enterica serovar Virchow]|nr:hypothetical protein [Salmonella enterica subsp. enterica serovar Virchow]EEM5598715.1 hypothetical protein [Salmonella enterica subsp. enterica serovar Virchow]